METLFIRNVLENVTQKGKYKLKSANFTKREQFSAKLKPISIWMENIDLRDKGLKL